VLIDDGSDEEHKSPFREAAKKFNCHVLVHPQNYGKGAALKTAFRYAEKDEGIEAVITVDGDNQHSAPDVLKIAESVLKENKLVLGVREFTGAHVPFRSSLGNRTTSLMFRLLFGLKISDTQTGLRGIPKKNLPAFIELAGERFEYETNMLLSLKRLGVDFCEVPINTVYENKNETSHFKPFGDSFKIFGLMFKFLFSSVLSSAIDVGAYWIIYKALIILTLKQRVFYATLIARVISSLFNYFVNSQKVFKSEKPMWSCLLKYYLLAVCQFLCSYFGVYLLTSVFGMSVLMKIIVDGLLFLISFKIQQKLIF
ncbi:MAG: bifunctional glycosyltransferase family 2/GtrA family protein, partial [Oscillospiraceae bacterium]